MLRKDRCLNLIKANPHLSSKYFETVCCAGIGEDGKWRRQYPISFRVLEDAQKFKRWSWIEYEYIKPRTDNRWESQKVQDNSIQVKGPAKTTGRTTCLDHLIFSNFSQPEERGDSLTLIRPTRSHFHWKRRHPDDVAKLKRKHAEIVNQGSLFHRDAEPLAQCPYSFHFTWYDDNHVKHESTCDDWETSATFFKRRRIHGTDDAALNSMENTFNNDYPNRGFVLAFSTHSLRNWQWLLVGILRADMTNQTALL